jgi:hypothetical protein
VQYSAHLRHLEVHSQILDIADAGAREEPLPEDRLPHVKLAEPGDILELLLQFMYPRPQPDLEEQLFERVLALATAAHKYGVHAAIQKCEDILMYVPHNICQ